MSEALEARFATALAGVHLVCEADISDVDLDLAEHEVRQAIRRGAVDQFARRCPATLASYLALAGASRYEGHAVWPALGVTESSSDVGKSFLSALRSLNLDTFQEQVQRNRARRYVTPMLIHGAFPADAASKFADRLEQELRRGLVDAREARVRMVNDPYLALEIRTPAARLLEWAPDYAERLIDGVLDFIEGGRPETLAAVPRHLRAALQERADRTRGLRRLRPPHIEFALDGLGPEVVMPDDSADWQLLVGDVASDAGDAERMEVRPDSPIDALSRGRRVRLWSLNPAWVFTELGTPLPEDRPLPTHVLMLAHREASMETDPAATLRVVEEGPDLTGAWTGYRALRAELMGADRLHVTGPTGTCTWTVASNATPTLEGAPVEGVLEVSGAKVFAKAPRVAASSRELLVSFRSGHDVAQAVLPAGGGHDLSTLIPSHPTSGRLTVSAIDSGISADFDVVVVPGLRVEPCTILGPSDAGEIVVHADRAVLPVPRRLAVRPHQARVPLHLDVGREAHLEVAVPRLQWGIRASGPQRLEIASGVIHTSIEDLVASMPALVVRCGVQLDVGLALSASGQPTHQIRAQQLRRLGPADFGLTIDLAPMRDTLRHADGGVARLDVLADGQAFAAVVCGTPEAGRRAVRTWNAAGRRSARRDAAPSLWRDIPEVEELARARWIESARGTSLEQHLRRLSEADAVVDFLLRLGRAADGWDLDEFPDGRSGREWQEFADASARLWNGDGFRLRTFGGARGRDLDLRLSPWARTWRERLRRTPPDELMGLRRWLLGRVPRFEAFDHWEHGEWVNRCRGQGTSSDVQQVPAVLLVHCLSCCAGVEESGSAVAEAAEHVPQMLLEIVAFLVQAARWGTVFEPPPPPEVPGPDELDPDGAALDAEDLEANLDGLRGAATASWTISSLGRTICVASDRPSPAPAVRISAQQKCLLVRQAVPNDDMAFGLELPADIEGTVSVEVVEGDLGNDAGSGTVIFVPRAARSKSARLSTHSLADVGNAFIDCTVDHIVHQLDNDQFPTTEISTLFDDPMSAAAGVRRFALRERSASQVDRLAIAVMSQLSLDEHDSMPPLVASAIRRTSPLMYALLAGRSANHWAQLGWPANVPLMPGQSIASALAKWGVQRRRRMGEDCNVRTWRYRPLAFEHEPSLRRALAMMERAGVDPGYLDVVVAVHRALLRDELTIEATRMVLDVHSSSPKLAADAALVGFAAHRATWT